MLSSSTILRKICATLTEWIIANFPQSFMGGLDWKILELVHRFFSPYFAWFVLSKIFNSRVLIFIVHFYELICGLCHVSSGIWIVATFLLCWLHKNLIFHHSMIRIKIIKAQSSIKTHSCMAWCYFQFETDKLQVTFTHIFEWHIRAQTWLHFWSYANFSILCKSRKANWRVENVLILEMHSLIL